MDKFILNYSAVLGLLDDTKMTSKEFRFSGSFFFIGQILIQVRTPFDIFQIEQKKKEKINSAETL